MRGYDAWLVRGWEERCAAEDAFIRWCDNNDEDPDHPDTYERFQEAMEDAAEAHAERLAEERAEARAAGW